MDLKYVLHMHSQNYLTLSSPYKFEAPWNAWEFAYHILHREANLVILSMAWLTREDARSYSRAPKEPDMETLSYWLARLEPVIRAEEEGEIIVVLANRCGIEDEAVYAGSSAVLGIQGGEVKVYGILGRGEKELLVVDTTLRPQAKLVSDPSMSLANPKRESAESYSDASRTDSAISTFSDESSKSSATNLSIDTQNPERRLSLAMPATPNAMEVTIDDIIMPISPIDPKSPSLFFGGSTGHIAEPDSKRGSLISTIRQPQNSDVIDLVEVFNMKPDTPTLSHHEPPKQRYPVREDVTEYNDSYPMPTGATEMNDAHAFVRPPSPKSRNCSRTRHREYNDPALMSHDLAQEPQVTSRSIMVKSPPHSASAVPDHYQQTHVDQGLCPRSRHAQLPRPKSMVW
jgi:hypothetical protein